VKLVIKPKTKCCKDSPYRCKRCPVVCKKLVKRGLAHKRDDGLVVLRPDLTKKAYKAARAR
jgi:aldehyde:ferredoxin oxidoreductase